MSQSTSQPPVEAEELYNVAHMSATGVRFVPADKELIAHYLQRKLRGQPLPADVVHVGDVYAEHPMNLARELDKSFEGSCWYMFSPRRPKYPRGMRPRRCTGDGAGFWKSMGAKQEVHGADRREVIGYKCGLTFHKYVREHDGGHLAGGGNPPARRRRTGKKPTEWKMLELVSVGSNRAPDDAAVDPMLLNEWVLCRITNKSSLEGWEGPGLPDDPEDDEEQAASSGGDRPHDDQHQQATAEAPNGGDTAAAVTSASTHQPGFDEGLYHGANLLDDDLQQFSWLDGLLNLDNYVGTADGGGETSSQDGQPAEQQPQAASGGGAGSRDEPKQAATAQDPDGEVAAAAATGEAPGDHDWKRRRCGNLSELGLALRIR